MASNEIKTGLLQKQQVFL